ncbi:MAG TPA: pilus assembly protein TadG-related protein [Candidatus Acidoferrum sp.]|nr:pilus assembly protein TadG-related protein [Candidatus Acidoferrum sp.]
MRVVMVDETHQELASERGQAMVFVLLALGLFLVAAAAFAVDIANLWFHRQTAQNAADSACASGAMDILAASQGASTANQGFTIGTAFNCSTTSGATPCEYAALNGYNGANATPGNQVQVSFPSSDPNVTNATPPMPPSGMTSYPFIRVDVVDHVQTFFSGLLTGNQTQDVRAFSVCGALLVQSPAPIIVLDPQNEGSTAALSVTGSPEILIYGGPQRSIQINSSNATAVTLKSGATINLAQGGPSLTGSNIGVFGGPTVAPSNVSLGTTGTWEYPAAMTSDPFATLCAPGQSGCPQVNGNSTPAKPSAPTVPSDEAAKGCKSIPCSIVYHDAGHGCPTAGGCLLYTPGYYASGIAVKSNTAVFDPGLYYLVGGLALQSNSIVRPGTGAGDGSGGTVFYFSGTSTITVVSGSGKSTTDAFVASSMRCTGSSTLPGNLPATTAIQGNVLLAPCTGYYGDPLGSSDPLGIQRGMLFFQDRSASNVSATWTGNSQFLLTGSMYFHYCNSSGTGTGCGAPPTYYDDDLSLTATACSDAFVVGSIVVDNLAFAGSSCLTIDPNPSAAYWIMKATLVR